jgi:hypothetical protein
LCHLNRELDKDTNYKIVAKHDLKKRKERRRRKHCKRSSGLLPGGTETLVSLFKDQIISCKVGKIWAVLREELGWLAGLINTALSHNMGYSA